MPGHSIHFTESATQDLEDILQYYTEQQVPHVGEKLGHEIIYDIELLIDQPDMG